MDHSTPIQIGDYVIANGLGSLHYVTAILDDGDVLALKRPNSTTVVYKATSKCTKHASDLPLMRYKNMNMTISIGDIVYNRNPKTGLCPLYTVIYIGKDVTTGAMSVTVRPIDQVSTTVVSFSQIEFAEEFMYCCTEDTLRNGHHLYVYKHDPDGGMDAYAKGKACVDGMIVMFDITSAVLGVIHGSLAHRVGCIVDYDSFDPNLDIAMFRDSLFMGVANRLDMLKAVHGIK